LSGTTYSNGFAGSLSIDAAGNVYAVGEVFTPGNAPVYWKASGGNWASNSPTQLSVTGYPPATYTYWNVHGAAVDSSGNVDAQATIATTGAPPETNNYFSSTSTPPGTLIYWKGGTPSTLPLGSYTSWGVFWGAVDSSGNYFVTGSVATDAQAAAGPSGQGIPAYWKNGGTLVPLPMGSNGGKPNTFGKAEGIMFGQ